MLLLCDVMLMSPTFAERGVVIPMGTPVHARTDDLRQLILK